MVGNKPKYDVKLQKQLNKFNYVKHSKWFAIFSFGIIIAGIVVFSTFAGIAGSISGGWNISQEFSGGTIATFKKEDNKTFNSLEQKEIYNEIKKNWR